MEDTAIPMQRGNMEDIAQETSVMETSEASSMETSSTSTQHIYDRESRFVTMNYCYCLSKEVLRRIYVCFLEVLYFI
jgi:hypothetical protein